MAVARLISLSLDQLQYREVVDVMKHWVWKIYIAFLLLQVVVQEIINELLNYRHQH